MAEDKLLLIPGPSPVVPRILEALALPTVSHVGPDMVRDLAEACENLKRIVFCDNGEPFIVAGAGTLSMEMALVNTAGAADRVLVVSQGYFGDRMAQICRAFGIEHDVLECEWGRAVTPGELERRIKSRSYNVVVCTHVDTATGACAPVEEYAQVLSRTGAIFIVDGVCATGGIPERMDAWGIDVVLTAAQKCLGTPPGLTLCVFSEAAMEKRRGLASIPAYYSDILLWLPVMRDPAKYFSTPCVNEIRAFAEATRIVIEEGIEERFERHELYAGAVRAGLAALGFSFFTDPRFAAATLSVVRYPDGVEDKAFRAGLYARGVVVAGGLGPTAGRVFRMGHMGNLTSAQVRLAIDAVEATLAGLGRPVEAGSGRRAVDAVLKA
ncbi:MAG TPA: alanine--glyoxylate aminotransferase family protein [Candidatus Aminicenantes bacterium]|nr:alanine--glyoxylate aminotransferase family protein [Candidatus Aminicenantes bacterium]HRY65988.1 alanine--glyoxylate aminotransferase family protein [Candidatus Aminicenantes bacterium]HRZ72963.1 alanine--glyoxylate aminotransferase family protein [Candidatus Aminicenantes bacterium]